MDTTKIKGKKMIGDTKRSHIVVKRHAKALINPDTKISDDSITIDGALDSIEEGKNYYSGHKGSFFIYYSGAKRTLQTAANINVGIGRVAEVFDVDKNLRVVSPEYFPKGVPYGPEFIDYIVQKHREAIRDVGSEVKNFVVLQYQQHRDKENPLIIGISHAPKVEIGYGSIMNVPKEELGKLVASPLDGFDIVIDTKSKSGLIDLIKIKYKEGEFQTIPKEYLFK